MRLHRFASLSSCLVLGLAAVACGGSGGGGNDGVGGVAGAGGGSAGTGGSGGGQAGTGGGSAGSAGAGGAPACPTDTTVFEVGDSNGHADPYGARAAGQARAGRLADAAMIVQPAHGRQQIEVGDFVLANDKIAVVIEDADASDGYAVNGGEIMAIDKVGDDGRPMGLSMYFETLMGLSIELVNPSSVSVINDGSDGNAAVVRASGRLQRVPFLDGGPLGAAFAATFGNEVAYDYVLEPGSERLLIRLGFINPSPDPVDALAEENHGFFHNNQNDLVLPGAGFAEPMGTADYVGWVSGEWNFAWRPFGGEPLSFAFEVSGVQLFKGPGFAIPGCEITWTDHAELIGGGPYYDGLAEAVRRVDGDAPWREITGTVNDASGNPVADAWVHELDSAGGYFSRVKTDSSGNFSIHAPDADVTLAPYLRGYPLHAGMAVGATTNTATLAFGPTASIEVNATDLAGGQPLPVRVQVIPAVPVAATPATYGQRDEEDGRLHQDYAITGSTTLTVPVGTHRVVVSRGFEWELVDTMVTVAANETATVDAVLEHSVDSTGVMCADFHIHTNFSVDSKDPMPMKVSAAVADGLEIPVSSEHEWVADFAPVISDLGLSQWAFGMASEELTTFHWGHFGIVPLTVRPGEVNNGAAEWIGMQPPEVFAGIQALPEDPVLIINHPSSGSFGAYFSSAQFDETTGAGLDAALWSTDFDAIEVFNDASLDEDRAGSVAHWFALLNAGETFWAVGSSDSHFLRTSPVGYPRTCLALGSDDPTTLTPNRVRDVLATGASTISGGLYMDVAGPGGEMPGEMVLANGASVDFVVTVQAPSWMDATELEVIVDGVTQSTVPLAPMGGGTAQRFVNNVTVTVDTLAPRSWVVFHARGARDLAPLHPGRDAFAVSNPIFVTQM